MQPLLQLAYRQQLLLARQAYQHKHWLQAFSHLEQAHILGQRYLWPHLQTHWWMLKCGWRQRSRREVVGQCFRLLAVGPGFLIGWVPLGNTGGANVPALKPMPVPPQWHDLLPGTTMWRGPLLRILLLIGFVIVFTSQ